MSLLNDEQQKAVETNDSSLLIIAGAGTGKTRVLVEKIIYLLESDIPGTSILALTFTNKAADEMRVRVSQRCAVSPPFVGTFHAFCVQLLRQFSDTAEIPSQFLIFDRDACRRIIKRCMKQQGVTDFTPRVIQHAISELKTERAAAEDGDAFATASRLLPLYTLALQQERALDFDDLIVTTIKLLSKDAATRRQVQLRYTYILIDEFQDTDILQNRLIALLKNTRTRIMAVGDTDQTIYSWRGAHVENMLDFTKRYAPASTVMLTKNYRSSDTIIAAANAVIEKNMLRQDKVLLGTRGTGVPISHLQSDDQESEGSAIASEIARLHEQGAAYNSIAILFRANFQARAIETSMLAAHLPYTVLGTRFFDRAEIKDLLAYLTLLRNPQSEEAFRRATGVPQRGIGARTLDAVFSGNEHTLAPRFISALTTFRHSLAHLARVADEKPVDAVLHELVGMLSYQDYLIKIMTTRMNECVRCMS